MGRPPVSKALIKRFLEKGDCWIWVAFASTIEELGKAIRLGEYCDLELDFEPIKAIEHVHGFKT